MCIYFFLITIASPTPIALIPIIHCDVRMKMIATHFFHLPNMRMKMIAAHFFHLPNRIEL